MSAIADSYLIAGPCTITDNSQVIYTEGDVVINVAIEERDINTSAHGNIDQLVLGAMAEISCTPVGVWTLGMRGVLFPSKFIAPTAVGGRVFNGDNAVVINSATSKVTFPRCQLTQMPELNLGLKGNLFGEAKWTALRKDNTAMVTANSLYTHAAGDAAFDDFPTLFDQVACTAAWGAVTGFTAMTAKEGWVLQHELDLAPIDVQGEIKDYRIKGYRAFARGLALEPTLVQRLDSLGVQGTGYAQGRRRSASAADLVISGTGLSVTAKAADLKSAPFTFGNETLRNGDLGFQTQLGFTSGAADARLVLA